MFTLRTTPPFTRGGVVGILETYPPGYLVLTGFGRRVLCNFSKKFLGGFCATVYPHFLWSAVRECHNM